MFSPISCLSFFNLFHSDRFFFSFGIVRGRGFLRTRLNGVARALSDILYSLGEENEIKNCPIFTGSQIQHKQDITNLKSALYC